MNERASAYNAKAEAARTNRKLVRSRSRRRVAFSSFALFALVFTLLSFRLAAGLDPSTGNTVATTSTPSVATAGGEHENETSTESDDDDDSSSSASGSSSAGSTTSNQATTPAPTTKAS